MKVPISFLYFFLFMLTFLRFSHAQNIYYDSEVLMKMGAILEESADIKEDALLEVTTAFLTVLNTYDQPFLQEEIVVRGIEQLAEAYQKNTAIYDLLTLAKEKIPIEIREAALQEAAMQIAFTQQQPRYRMLRLLRAKNATSPAEYLSIRKTLQKYQLPTNTQAAASRIAETPIKSIPQKGVVGTELKFVTGLFQVILNNASKEVAVTYLENLLEQETPNLKKLFPNVIDRFRDVEVNYSDSFMNRLRTAFFADLQALKVNLPLLMLEEEYFSTLQSDPIAYNLLALYSILGLVQSDVPLEETLPVTHRYLYQGYIDAVKEINDTLAINHYESIEYRELVDLVVAFKDQLKRVYLLLNDQEEAIVELGEEFEEDINLPIADDFLTSKADLEILLSGENSSYDLFLLPSLLQGTFENSIVEYNTLAYYDYFFGEDFTPANKRAAGLELVRNLSGTWYQEATIIDLLNDWLSNLKAYEQAVEEWRWSVGESTLLEREAAIIEVKRDALYQRILREKEEYWIPFFNNNDTLTFPQDEHLAFDLLANIIKDFNAVVAFSPKERQQQKEELLHAVEDRAERLSWKLKDRYRYYIKSPIDLQIIERQRESTAIVQGEIDKLGTQLIAIERQLEKLDQRVGHLTKKKKNVVPILQSTELMTGLLFGLKDNNANWLSTTSLNELLDKGQKEALFLGLIQQTLGAVNDIGIVAPTALSNFIQLTLQELLQSKNPLDTIGKYSLKKFKLSAFIVNTLNNVLELPLLVDYQATTQFIALKDRYPSLKEVPTTSRSVLDFIHALDAKDHSQAISSLIRVMTAMDAMTLNSTQSNKPNLAITYLRKYGNFIADLIDAREKDQIADLLSGITAPPGSSRIKRRRPLAISINAYLGANLGVETWRADNTILPENDNFFNAAPSIPIGLTFSKKIGKKGNQQSWSLFASILDLGGLFSYRSDADAVGESQFNFINMIKPGAQVHYNFPKSPFYLGVGVQYGPQRRRIDGQDVNISSTRYLIGFGIDIPLLTLHQKFEG